MHSHFAASVDRVVQSHMFCQYLSISTHIFANVFDLLPFISHINHISMTNFMVKLEGECVRACMRCVRLCVFIDFMCQSYIFWWCSEYFGNRSTHTSDARKRVDNKSASICDSVQKILFIDKNKQRLSQILRKEIANC